LWREDRSRPARCRHEIGYAFIDSIVLHSIHAVLKAEREWKRDCHGTGERNTVLETSQLHRFEFPLHHPAEVIESRHTTLTFVSASCLFVGPIRLRIAMYASKRSLVSRDRSLWFEFIE
jgi:hypothetical protein